MKLMQLIRVSPRRIPRLSKVVGCALIIIFSFSQSVALAETSYPYQVYVQGGTYTFEVTNTANDSTDALSGFGAYSIGLGAVFFQQFLIFGGYSLILSDGFGGSTATGLDFGVRYYHWTRASLVNVSENEISITAYNLYNPYVGLAVRSRDFLSTLTSTYLGLGLFVGLDYRFKEDYFLNGEFRYEQLESPASKTVEQINFMFGVGTYF